MERSSLPYNPFLPGALMPGHPRPCPPARPPPLSAPLHATLPGSEPHPGTPDTQMQVTQTQLTPRNSQNASHADANHATYHTQTQSEERLGSRCPRTSPQKGAGPVLLPSRTSWGGILGEDADCAPKLPGRPLRTAAPPRLPGTPGGVLPPGWLGEVAGGCSPGHGHTRGPRRRSPWSGRWLSRGSSRGSACRASNLFFLDLEQPGHYKARDPGSAFLE